MTNKLHVSPKLYDTGSERVIHEQVNKVHVKIFSWCVIFSHPEKERAMVEYYACNECGEVFNKAKKLRAHQKLHIVSNVFACEICGTVFSNRKVSSSAQSLC